ncbi:MAG: SDR family oxidoreductase [bacterium]|nr:SDR family oxidoreductase [bacterium]
MKRIFITGATRGLGLEMVRQYAQQGNTQIFATYRDEQHAHTLKSLATQYAPHIELVPLDVANPQSISEIVHHVEHKTNGLDLLINNAGVDPKDESQTIGSLTMDGFLDVLRINTVAPALIVQALLPLLKAGHNARIVNISSEMASIEHRTYGGSHSYCASKAALNMVSRGLAADLTPYNIIVIALDPGWVQTDMGGKSATLTPHESISGVIKVVDGLTMRQTGHYLNYRGKNIPW